MQFALSAVWLAPMTEQIPNALRKQEKKMHAANNPDTELYLLIGIVAAFFLFLLLFGLVSFFNGFSHELRYLNSEIRRTEGDEQIYWIRQRRRLWLSLIPFVKY